MGKAFIISIFTLQSFTAFSFQSEVLFRINSNPTSEEEFIYFYQKNNQNNSNLNTKEDVKQYLNLFIDFKLKVQEAERLGYDTTSAFKGELKTYLGQLSESYLKSTESSEELVNEAYQRMQEDVDASHILIRLPENPSPKDTTSAYLKAMSIYEQAINGENFDELAANLSEEPNASITKGRLGYFTVFQMVYLFETASYKTPIGKISKPIRTQFGYHIIKINDRRHAMGVVNVAHIMVRLTNSMSHQDSVLARQKIFEVYDSLQNEGDWDDLCNVYSDDLNSKKTGGRLRPFGVRGLNVPSFENQAYALSPGIVSKPFLTPYGWHIIKVLDKKGIGTFDDEKNALEQKVKSDSRSAIPELRWVNKMKDKHQFIQKNNLDTKIRPYYDSTQIINQTDTLFTLDNKPYMSQDFKEFLNGKLISSQSILNQNYDRFVINMIKAHEEIDLESNNFEYKMLRKEYYQGILLFSIMEDLIWKKAEIDSIGLLQFYEDNKFKYKTEGREGLLISTQNDSVAQEIFGILSKGFDHFENNGNPQTIKNWAMSLISSESTVNLTYNIVKYRLDDPFISGLTPGVNQVVIDKDSGVLILSSKVEEWIQDLTNIKGLVISDYQTVLEKKWVENLRNKNKILINKKGLKHVLKVVAKTNS